VNKDYILKKLSEVRTVSWFIITVVIALSVIFGNKYKNSISYFTIILIGALLVMVFLVPLLKINKKRNRDSELSDIISDETKIIRTNNTCGNQEFATFFNSKRRHYLFIALTITNNLNLIHFAILSKLMQLQRYKITPLIYLVNDTKLDGVESVEKQKIQNSFLKFLHYFLKRGSYKILNKPTKKKNINSTNKLKLNINNKIIHLLEKTTLGEVSCALSMQKEINNESTLLEIFMPIIEIMNLYFSQKEGTTVLCGEELLDFWKLGHDKLNISPLIFLLPRLKKLDGEIVKPRETTNVLNLSFSDSDITSKAIQQATCRDSLLQIYSFFVFPIYERKKEIFIIKNGDSIIEIKKRDDIYNKLNGGLNVSIERIKQDLIEKIPPIMSEITKSIL